MTNFVLLMGQVNVSSVCISSVSFLKVLDVFIEDNLESRISSNWGALLSSIDKITVS